MGEWKKYRLGDLCTKIGSGATPKGGKSAYQGGEFALVRSQNVLDFYFSKDGLAYINSSQAEELRNVEIKEGDVLLNITGDSVARVCKIPNSILPARVNQHVAIIRADSTKTINDFILYYLQYKKRHLLSLAGGGATRNALTKGMIENFSINLPSLEEQRKIAEMLSEIDEKIAINCRICENLEAQAQALFKHWFIDFAPFKDGKFVESELGMIPEGWRVGRLGDYCKVKSGFAFKSSMWTGKGCPVIKIKNITNSGRIDMTDCSFISKQNVAKAKVFKANRGDLVIAMTGATIGKFSILPQFNDETYINQRVGKFFLGNNPLEKLPFVFCLLSDNRNRKKLTTMGQGSAQPNISGSDIESIIAVYSNNVIESFNEICYPIFDLILTKQEENLRLSTLRDTLLPKLMSGQIKL